jgi:hypothetical protein
MGIGRRAGVPGRLLQRRYSGQLGRAREPCSSSRDAATRSEPPAGLLDRAVGPVPCKCADYRSAPGGGVVPGVGAAPAAASGYALCPPVSTRLPDHGDDTQHIIDRVLAVLAAALV